MANTSIFIVIMIVMIFVRICLHFLDKSQLHDYFASKSDSIYDIKWSPFLLDSFFEKNERFYTVRYYDSDKNLHVCICKTSLLGGIYIKEDYIAVKSKKE